MSALKKKKSIPYKLLKIDYDYEGFKEFYDENKKIIYSSIIETFNGFFSSRRKNLKLMVSAKIQGCEWDTEFNFTREDHIILKRDVLPFFEEIEDYETCNKILKLHEDFTN